MVMTLSRGVYGLTLVAFFAMVVACDKPRCEPMDSCDIRHQKCQRAAVRLAKCLRRDESALDVDVVTLDYKKYRDDTQRVVTGRTARETDFLSGLSLFGLSSSDLEQQVQSRAGWVGAFYSRVDKRVTVLDHGQAMDDAGYVALLVHEMVHALQDASGDNAKGPVVEHFDAWLAQRAITEGEATLLADQALTEGLGWNFDEIGYGRVLRSFTTSSLERATASEDFFGELTGLFPYAYGARYLWQLQQRSGSASLREVYKSPPLSVAAIMAGPAAASAHESNDLGADAVPTFDGMLPTASVRLGRFAYETFVRRWGSRDGASTDEPLAGRHFVGDTLSVFTVPNDGVFAVWRIRLDDSPSARLLKSWLASRSLDVLQGRLESRERDVWITLAESAPVLDRLPDPDWVKQPGPDFMFERDSTVGLAAGCGVHDLSERQQ